MFHDESQQSVLAKFSPKTSFLLGIAVSILAVCTIGFFVLLALMFSGKFKVGGSDVSVQGAPAAVAQAPTAAPQAAPAPSGTVQPVSKNDHIRGDQNAKVTLIEYSDLECPYCKQFHPSMTQLMQNYSGKVKWVYRHFPLSFHQNAEKEAEATECANELGGNDKFWAYVDTIFQRTTSNGTGFPADNLVPLAKELGLNEQKFKSCLDSGKYAKHVADDEAGGQAAGVNGTPGTFIISSGGKSQLIPGAVPYEQLKAAVDAAL